MMYSVVVVVIYCGKDSKTMFKQYQQEVEDSTPGMFEGESPMTAYVHELLMNGEFGDDELRWNDGSSAIRYGRRILSISSNGFVSLETFRSASDAEKVFADARQDEISDICNQSVPEDIWTEVEDGAWWIDELNVSGDDLQAAVVEQFGALITDDALEHAYSRKNYGGVAWRIVSPSWECRVNVVMVGDDTVHMSSMDELTVLDEEAYCRSCGQIGCGWH